MSADTTDNHRARPEGVRVALCICTYRRAHGLQRLLSAVNALKFGDRVCPSLAILVADNECSTENEAICNRFAHDGRYSITYLAVPQRGISFARNACLEHLDAGTDFVAMIDDDEVPDPHWLDKLLLAQNLGGADIVAGPVVPVFEPQTPRWVDDCGWFDKPHDRQRYRHLQPNPPVATCNALVRAAPFTRFGLRFDPQLARSGGEDQLLFQRLTLDGYRSVWAADALAEEYIPPNRANLRYMCADAFRRGSTKYYIKSRLKAAGRAKRLKLAIRSWVRAMAGLARASVLAGWFLLAGGKHRHRAVRSLLEIAENAGFLAGVHGYRKTHY